MLQAHVAIFLSSEDDQVFDNINRLTAIDRHQLGSHGCSVQAGNTNHPFAVVIIQ